jgi:outer membrane biosynthesis protein TonB
MMAVMPLRRAPSRRRDEAAMERWQFIQWGIAASVLAHVLLAGAIVLSTDVRRYDQAAPEAIAVDIVSDAPEKLPEPLPTPSPSPDLTLPQPAASATPQPSPSEAAAEPAAPASPQPEPTPGEAAKPQARATPQPQAQPQPPPAPQPQPAPPPAAQQQASDYVPAQPDLTVKYGVMLGLPDALPPLAMSGDRADEREAGSMATTNLAAELVTALRRHLRSCSRLSRSLSPADNVRVKLRVALTPDGRIAGEPALIEGTASMKGVELKQSAANALMACQPYAMLRPDRYRDWKVLELSFTPQDFAN